MRTYRLVYWPWKTKMSISISIKLITSVLRNVIGPRLLLSIMLVFSSGFTYVMASEAPSPNISIGIDAYYSLGYGTFNASVDQSPYIFEVYIGFPEESHAKSDLYFGMIQPGNDIYTWVTVDGVSNLEEGLAPIVKGVDKETKYNDKGTKFFHISGRDVKYQFTESDPPGIYFIFALLVPADSTPSDTRNWIEVSIRPLIFNP